MRSTERASRARRILAFAGVLLAPSGPAPAATCDFTNPTPVVIGESTVVSSIEVGAVAPPITGVEVRLDDLAESVIGIEELDVLLVSPAGREVILLSFACLETRGPVDLAFSAAAPETLPSADAGDGEPCASGLYRPGDYSALVDGYLFEKNPPAPPPPCPGELGDLVGDDPNGTWRLYAAAFTDLDDASLQGWSLRFEAAGCDALSPELFADGFESGSACAWSDRAGQAGAC